ncbi:transposase [Sinorhizobium fredii]|uniref:transposase n=1 Tax=Rhizobium fredii TaxID=380 RepID=UPI003B3B076A
MATAAGGICSTISHSAATRAVSRISSGFSQAGAAPRSRSGTVRRRCSDHTRSTGPRCCPDPRSGDRPPVVAAALCMKPRSMLTITPARKVDALKQGSPEFALMRSLGMRFRGIFRSRDPGKLDSWIDDADNSGLVAIERFARVLHRDLDAVYNAIELPWSNGQAEGQINRLKTIKRAMYGRAGPQLLRARILPLNNTHHHTK